MVRKKSSSKWGTRPVIGFRSRAAMKVSLGVIGFSGLKVKAVRDERLMIMPPYFITFFIRQTALKRDKIIIFKI